MVETRSMKRSCMVETRSMKRSRRANTGSSSRVIEDDYVRKIPPHIIKRKKENSSSSSSTNSSGSFEEEDDNVNGIDYFGVDGLKEEERVKHGMFSASDISMVSLHPDEYTNIPLTDEERRCYESPEYKAAKLDYHQLRWRGNVPELGCKEYHFITRKEASIYCKAIKKSQGYDLAFLPYSVMRAGMMTPVLLHKYEDVAQELARYSKLALRYYNKKNGTNYDFKRLVKANAQAACVKLYRITFVAGNFAAYPAEQDTTFQAKVLLKLRRDIEILLCRIKPCQRG
ncbi:hypothetical protein LguiA_024981 [Lonicera macranthoides]